MRKIVLLTLLLAASLPAMAQSSAPRASGEGASHYGWADVLRVDPVYADVRVATPLEDCAPAPQQQGNAAAGAVLGAVVGGVLGNAVGKGDGRKAATVAGAVIGGVVGHGVAQSRQDEGAEAACDPQAARISHQRRLVGYDVEYSYHGDIYMSRLGYDPGERLRVRVTVSPAD